MPESPAPPTPPPRDWKGIALLATFTSVVVVGLWLQWTVTADAGRGGVLRADRIESAVVGIMLAVVGASSFMLWRLARRVRVEMAQRNQLIHELRVSEAKYRSIFDNAIEGIFQTTPEGRFITANKALARMYGYRSPEHLIESLADISTQLYVDPGQREALLEALREEDVVSNFEFEVRRADGRMIWLRENVRAIRDEAGRIMYLEGTVEDVSAHWWSEHRRRLQYTTARVLADAASVAEARPKLLQGICEILEWDLGAVWDVDPAGGVLRCVEIWHSPNVDVAEFERANTSTTYAFGSGLAGEVWQSGEPKWIANLAQEAGFPNAAIAVKAGMGSAFCVPIKVRGEVRHVFEFFSPKISLPDPELLHTLSTIGNELGHLIERKAAELLAAELAAVVANSDDAIIACRLEGRVRSWNAGAERIYGYTAAEAVGRPLHMLFPPDRLDEFPRILKTVRDGGSLTNFETVRIRKDGRKITVSITISPIRGERGTITGLSAIARDITERKRLETELLQSQKMDAVGRLAGGIAHDFNNILTAVLGYSDLLIGQIDEKHWMFKHLSEIRKAADFASSLTHQLLAFSRRQPMVLRVFSMNDSVRNMEKMLHRVIGEHIAIETRLGAEIGRIKADPGQLEQVLLNLCVNSRDAMPDGGSITIATADVTYVPNEPAIVPEMPAGEYVKLTVSDTGTGIPPDVLTHIFEPFFTTKEKGQGTGLGLATCYGIVKQTGGYIAVESTAGMGATFSIYLPRVEESGEHAVPRQAIGLLPGGKETILYVEDEISVRSLTAHVLRRLGYTVFEATDAREARGLIESMNGRPIDLLFADVILPDLGGKELSVWVAERHRATKILFCSGYVDENILRRHGLSLGTAFLQKPFSPAELAAKVREVIDN